LVPEDLDFLYRPMWDIKRAAITTYLCQAMSIDSSGEMLFDYDVLPGASQSSVVSELDLRAAGRVLADLEKIAASGRKVLVSTTVHCHTLEDRDTRQAYTETLSGLSDDARRLLVFEIVGLDATASESRMHTSLSAVKSFGRTTVARMPIDMTTLSAFQNNGFASVGVHLEQKHGDERRLMGLFEQFVTLANRVGLRTFVHGIRSSSQAMIAMGAGFDHVDGDVVALSADRIGAVMRFQLTDLYGAANYSDIP
jgi:EAL domain-containing protein (putative c-di-GMP-specific phosphodiesterase class I)